MNFKSWTFPRVGIRLPALVVAAGAMLLPALAQAQLTGAIFTSTDTGTTVNANIYPLQADVYLNGGAQNTNSPGLPVGTYYFQVTDPSGRTLLSLDNAVCRQVVVTALSGGKGVISGVAQASVSAGCAHALGTTDTASGQTPVQLAPFDFTPNNGGEYKVWLIKASAATVDTTDSKKLNFANSNVKTDNFKVLERICDPNCNPPGPLYSISGFKFYDTDADGIMNNGEVGIPGFQIELFGDAASNTTTALNPQGQYSFTGLLGGTYGVCEVVPTGGQTWLSTTPTTISNIGVGPNSAGNNFGNVCIGPAGGNGRTLGFWSNNNGQAILLSNDVVWRTGLNALNLRRANGSDYDVPATAFSKAYADFRTWLLGANATNMAYMLSAQLSAMWLNVNTNGGPGASSTAMLYAYPQPAACTAFVGDQITGLSAAGFISAGNLIMAANAALANPNGNTTAAGDARTCQEYLKNALDRGNNNLNWVQSPAQCTVAYAGTEGACSPP